MSSVFAKENIERVGAIAIVFVAASYSFTLGYMEYLRIPETPEYLEASNFFIRAVLYAGVLPVIYLSIFVFFLLGFIFVMNKKVIPQYSEYCKPKYLECFKAVLKYWTFVIAVTALVFSMYSWGENSLDAKKGLAFPRGFLFINKGLVWEKPIVWFGRKTTYYLECNPSQPELRGINDEGKIVFARRISRSLIPILCKQ